jgi:hypothetical protein
MRTGWTLDCTFPKLCSLHAGRIVASTSTLEALEVMPDVNRIQKLIITVLVRISQLFGL